MADIFISYSQRDRERVRRLVDALTAEGYEVWWDLKIRAGESFDELIESTLEKVSCVVDVWSASSVQSELTPSAGSRLTLGASTICTATSGSGCRIAGTTGTEGRRPMVPLGKRQWGR